MSSSVGRASGARPCAGADAAGRGAAMNDTALYLTQFAVTPHRRRSIDDPTPDSSSFIKLSLNSINTNANNGFMTVIALAC